MPVITVVKAFDYNVPPEIVDWRKSSDGGAVPIYGPVSRVRYGPGSYEVSETMAKDAYVAAHLDGYVEPPKPTPSSLAAGQQQALWAQQAVRMATPIDRQMAHTTPPAPPAEPAVPLNATPVPMGQNYFAGGPQTDKPLPPDPLQNVAWASKG